MNFVKVLTGFEINDKVFTMSYLLLENGPREAAIQDAVSNLRKSGLEFRTIVACGLSGALIAPAIAARMNKVLVFVRKGESTHGHQVEIDITGDIGDYVIIDDLVEFGRTINRIRQALDGDHKYGGHCVGVYFYNQSPLAPFYQTFAALNKDLWTHASLS